MKKFVNLPSFLIFFSFFIISTNKVLAQQFNELNVKDWVFSRWCYSVKTCSLDSPPSGKTFSSLTKDFDRIVFLTSLQGLVNREQANLILNSYSIDSVWQKELKENDIWLNDWSKKNFNSLDEVISRYKNNSDLKGSVVWEANRPFTLNLAYTISGVENLVVVRKDSSIYSKIVSAFPVKKI